MVLLTDLCNPAKAGQTLVASGENIKRRENLTSQLLPDLPADIRDSHRVSD